MIDLTLGIVEPDCPFVNAASGGDLRFSAIQWNVDRAAGRMETRVAVEGEDRDTLETGLGTVSDHDAVVERSLLSKRGTAAHLRAVTEVTAAMETLHDHDGYLTGPFYVEDGRKLWRIGFDDRRAADDAIGELRTVADVEEVSREQVGQPELSEFVQNAGAAMTLIEGCRGLSEVERETLEAAVSDGYFENPRSATLGTLADEFDVSKPAVSKNLRRGQRKMIRRVVEAIDELEEREAMGEN